MLAPDAPGNECDSSGGEVFAHGPMPASKRSVRRFEICTSGITTENNTRVIEKGFSYESNRFPYHQSHLCVGHVRRGCGRESELERQLHAMPRQRWNGQYADGKKDPGQRSD